MSIDLCNKYQLTKDVGEFLFFDERARGPLDDGQRIALQLAYRSMRSAVDPRSVAGDPSAWTSDFAYALDRAAVRLDQRPNDVLRSDALGHPDPVMREQAFFEYADRNVDDAIELLSQVARNDRDRE